MKQNLCLHIKKIIFHNKRYALFFRSELLKQEELTKIERQRRQHKIRRIICEIP